MTPRHGASARPRPPQAISRRLLEAVFMALAVQLGNNLLSCDFSEQASCHWVRKLLRKLWVMSSRFQPHGATLYSMCCPCDCSEWDVNVQALEVIRM
jgi:hypothetical protein